MKVLVTGATGYIGREIVCELNELGHQVCALGNSQNILDEHRPNTTLIRADITDYKNLLDLETLGEVDVIVHSAGLAHQFGETSKKEFERVNVTGTENILKLGVSLRIKHFILIGSTAVYGIAPAAETPFRNAPVIVEESAVQPLTPYAESKLEAENVCRQFCEREKIRLTIFRLAPVIGEGNTGNVGRLISAIDRNRFVWIGNGDNLKTLIYKRDVARACAALIVAKQNHTEIFNLAGEPVRMKDFVNEIAVRLNKKIVPVGIPANFLRLFFQLNAKTLKSQKIGKIAETVEKWLSDDVYSAAKIARVYGYQTQTTIPEALAKQIDYYKSNRNEHGRA